MRIAVLGGGQLAKMTLLAGANLGIDFTIWSATADAPALRLTDRTVVGPLTDPGVRSAVAAGADVITLESEFIPGDRLRELESLGVLVLPGPSAVSIVQDKWTQKEALRIAGLPVAEGMALRRPDDLERARARIGLPAIVKTRRLGYDGHGTFRWGPGDDPAPLANRVGEDPDALLVEARIPFRRELAVIVSRGRDGTSAVYPVVETRQPRFICEEVWAPAPVPAAVRAAAEAIGRRAVEVLNLVGTAAVEMFETEDGRIVINEIAPRPHNSGHFSIEAAETSQFENHCRAVLGLPLGSPALRAPSAVMVNVLGEAAGPAPVSALTAALAHPGVHVHLYGKRDARPGRKLGHITVLADSLDEARDRALAARRAIPL